MTTVTGIGNPRLDSVWMSDPEPAFAKRGKQSALTRDQAVAAAVHLLDREGMEAMSMRRLGVELGVSSMSVYWHVPTKDALLEFVLDAVLGELDLDKGNDPDWVAGARALSFDLRRVVRTHPWVTRLTGVYFTVGPNALNMHEAFIRLLEQGGYRPPAPNQAAGTLVNFVLGFAADEAKWLQTMAETGLGPESIAESLLPKTLRALGDGHPRMRANIEAGENREWDDQFTFGLDCLLDGMRNRITGSRA